MLNLSKIEKEEIQKIPYVFFIRHSNFSDYTKLINDCRIGIHYNMNGNSSFEVLKAQYKKGYIKTSLNYFEHLSEYGGVIFAKYNILVGKSIVQKIIIGIVEKNTPIKSEIYSFNSDKKEVADLVKCIAYRPLRDFSYSFAPVLSIYGGRSTLAKYDKSHSFYNILKESILLGKRITGNKELIHPNCLEQLCVEWLREYGDVVFNSLLSYCYTGVGSSFPTIDFAGRLEDGRRVFAQVTFSPFSDIETKIENLENYVDPGSSDILIMFCDFDNNSSPQRKNVIFIDIKEVINDFLRAKKERVLNDFVGLSNVEWDLLK